MSFATLHHHWHRAKQDDAADEGTGHLRCVAEALRNLKQHYPKGGLASLCLRVAAHGGCRWRAHRAGRLSLPESCLGCGAAYLQCHNGGADRISLAVSEAVAWHSMPFRPSLRSLRQRSPRQKLKPKTGIQIPFSRASCRCHVSCQNWDSLKLHWYKLGDSMSTSPVSSATRQESSTSSAFTCLKECDLHGVDVS